MLNALVYFSISFVSSLTSFSPSSVYDSLFQCPQSLLLMSFMMPYQYTNFRFVSYILALAWYIVLIVSGGLGTSFIVLIITKLTSRRYACKSTLHYTLTTLVIQHFTYYRILVLQHFLYFFYYQWKKTILPTF